MFPPPRTDRRDLQSHPFAPKGGSNHHPHNPNTHNPDSNTHTFPLIVHKYSQKFQELGHKDKGLKKKKVNNDEAWDEPQISKKGKDKGKDLWSSKTPTFDTVFPLVTAKNKNKRQSTGREGGKGGKVRKGGGQRGNGRTPKREVDRT